MEKHLSGHPVLSGKCTTVFRAFGYRKFSCRPISQKEVFIIKPEVLEALLPQENADRLKHLKENPGELESTEPADLHPHFLPYKTIGEEGVLLAVVLDDLCIHTPREVIHVANPVLALAVEPSALGKEYQVLLNSRILH